MSVSHLPAATEFSTDNYHPKKKFKGRILWVDATTKAVGLTLQKRVVAGDCYSLQGLDIGDTVQGKCLRY